MDSKVKEKEREARSKGSEYGEGTNGIKMFGNIRPTVEESTLKDDVSSLGHRSKNSTTIFVHYGNGKAEVITKSRSFVGNVCQDSYEICKRERRNYIDEAFEEGRKKGRGGGRGGGGDGDEGGGETSVSAAKETGFMAGDHAGREHRKVRLLSLKTTSGETRTFLTDG
ncbi:hypothetical protein HZH68_006344 [Vespula germanica]|uniref:Uncharacterized protein n=1 Tax=Vespula germanica TaxID=30212 RepID=A0A834NC50_VESGE|nr:hypothetical protein HZH68_006344 [Vespula germanica]